MQCGAFFDRLYCALDPRLALDCSPGLWLNFNTVRLSVYIICLSMCIQNAVNPVNMTFILYSQLFKMFVWLSRKSAVSNHMSSYQNYLSD